MAACQAVAPQPFDVVAVCPRNAVCRSPAAICHVARHGGGPRKFLVQAELWEFCVGIVAKAAFGADFFSGGGWWLGTVSNVLRGGCEVGTHEVYRSRRLMASVSPEEI